MFGAAIFLTPLRFDAQNLEQKNAIFTKKLLTCRIEMSNRAVMVNGKVAESGVILVV